MARVKLNPALASFLGELGEMVFKMRYGKVYVSRKVRRKPREFSRAQKAVQERFRNATLYARRVMADPAERAPYEKAAKEKQTSIQNLIIADFLRPPAVETVDLSGYNGHVGSTIRIEASDDFDVIAVDVVLSTAAGEAIEQGSAILSAMKWGNWVYTATVSVPAGTEVRVDAKASDRPGNRGAKTAHVTV